MNLAVGVIIGAAFQSVVASLTDNILSPIIGLFTGQNFDGLQVEFLGVSLRYGAFITSVINFFIMAFVVFLLVKLMNKIDALSSAAKGAPAPEEAVPDDAAPEAPALRPCPYCLTEVPAAATRCPACTSQLGALDKSLNVQIPKRIFRQTRRDEGE
jgi:large conductance mechanosensitive channel